METRLSKIPIILAWSLIIEIGIYSVSKGNYSKQKGGNVVTHIFFIQPIFRMLMQRIKCTLNNEQSLNNNRKLMCVRRIRLMNLQASE